MCDFDAADIFNAEETNLFFRALSNKVIAETSEKCEYEEISKDLLSCSVQVLRIRNADHLGMEKPWCFKNVKIT